MFSYISINELVKETMDELAKENSYLNHFFKNFGTNVYAFDVELPGVKKEDIKLTLIHSVATTDVKIVYTSRRGAKLSYTATIGRIQQGSGKVELKDGVLYFKGLPHEASSYTEFMEVK